MEAESESDMEQAGVNPEVLYEMSYYANLAAEADNEAEADLFMGAVANLAGNLLPQLLNESDHEDAVGERDEFLPLLAAAVPLAAKFAPVAIKAASAAMPLIQSGIRVVGGMLNKPQTRHLRRTLPQIAARTTMSIARDVRAGKPVSKKRAMATLAYHTARQFATPGRAQGAIRNTQLRTRRFRRVCRLVPITRASRPIVRRPV
jgi:hypothetical protein